MSACCCNCSLRHGMMCGLCVLSLVAVLTSSLFYLRMMNQARLSMQPVTLPPEKVGAWAHADSLWGGSSGAEFAWPKVVRGGQCDHPGQVKVCPKSNVKFIILFQPNLLFGLYPFIGVPPKDGLSHFLCCDGVDVIYTTNSSLSFMADVVELDSRHFPEKLPPKEHPNQVFMAFTVEAPNTMGIEALKLFSGINLLRTYSRDADVPVTYHPAGGQCACLRFIQPLTAPFEKRNSAIMAALVSNCATGSLREKVLEYMMEKLPVHSMGACFHNFNIEKKKDITIYLRQYLYYFAVENTVCQDYITEKFYRAFATESVPVVFSKQGLPGYERVAPSKDSYVDLGSFPSMDSAIVFLNVTSRSKMAYLRHHSFRGNGSDGVGVSASFRDNVCGDQQRELKTWCDVVRRVKDPVSRQAILGHRMPEYFEKVKKICPPVTYVPRPIPRRPVPGKPSKPGGNSPGDVKAKSAPEKEPGGTAPRGKRAALSTGASRAGVPSRNSSALTGHAVHPSKRSP